ncbi:MAG: FliA/WhiG family RNA polymerase sigma factor [Candidatus Kapaibacteriota bacterium]
MQSIEELNKTWLLYKNSKSLELRNKLVLTYVPFVKSILRNINLPPNSILSESDLINFGIVGLIESIEKFNPEQNVKFETYAYQRIKGAIFDELRRIDWLSRNSRKKAKEFIETVDKSFTEKGGYDLDDVLKKLSVDENELKEYVKAYQSSQESFFLGDVIELNEEGDEVSYIENLPDEQEKTALDEIVENEKVQIIYEFLRKLPEKERLVVTLYYYENLKFKEIGKILGLSESRISQIHSFVLRKLKKKFEEFEK